MNNNHFIITEDGSTTLYLKEYDEAMHSISGAYEESLLKHIIPSNILENKNKSVSVLDIGFGLGYNILTLVYEFKKRAMKSELNIFSLEKMNNLDTFLENIKFNDSRDDLYNLIKQAYYNGVINAENIHIKLILGDARDSILKLLNNKFDAVFHDPFSPSKNPELWSVNFFAQIKDIMTNKAILTTYSSAVQIRKAMLEAGFFITQGPSVGRKKEGTLASKTEFMNGFNNQKIAEINTNPRSYPYYDISLNSGREVILNQRLYNIKRIK